VTKRIFVVVVILGFAGAAQAQTGVRAKDPALQAAIEARQKAVNTRNSAEYGKYSTDDFTVVTADGEIQSLGNRMKELAATTTNPNPAVVESVRMFGLDAAVSIRRNGGPEPSIITLVWVRQGGVWKAASRQSTRITKK
jgi:hypothetical protein